MVPGLEEKAKTGREASGAGPGAKLPRLRLFITLVLTNVAGLLLGLIFVRFGLL